MVLLPGTPSGFVAEPSHVVFSRSSDVVKFFFVFEQVRMPGRSDEEKAPQLICHLEGEDFDVYNDFFTRDGNLVERPRNILWSKMLSWSISSRNSSLTITSVWAWPPS